MSNIMEELEKLKSKADKYDKLTTDNDDLREQILRAISIMQEVYVDLGGHQTITLQPTPKPLTKNGKRGGGNRGPDKNKGRGKVGDDARAVIDYVNGLGKTVKMVYVMRVLGIPEGSGYKLRNVLKRSTAVKLYWISTSWYLTPRGKKFVAPQGAHSLPKPKPKVVVVKPKKQKRLAIGRRPYNKFMKERIPHYMKLGHYPPDAMRLAVADWHKFGKHQHKYGELLKLPEFEHVPKHNQDWIENMLRNAMNTGTPLKFMLDGHILGIFNYDEWLEFAREVIRNNNVIKRYFGDKTTRCWKLKNKELHFD